MRAACTRGLYYYFVGRTKGISSIAWDRDDALQPSACVEKLQVISVIRPLIEMDQFYEHTKKLLFLYFIK